MTSKPAFLGGLFLLCMCVLMLQIIETRILSVITYYHLAFFAISMAMFGMTAGSLIAYFNQALSAPERLAAHLSWIAAGFAVTTVLSTVVLISTVLLDPSLGILLSAMLWLKLIAALLPPYVFAGMGISLALTRSPWPVGLVYGSDLGGAAFGCLGALALIELLDAVSAMFMIAAVGAAAAFAFRLACAAAEIAAVALPKWAFVLGKPAGLFAGFALLAVGNAAIQPHGLLLSFAKGRVENPQDVAYMRWNSYSRIRAEKTVHQDAQVWAASPAMPDTEIDLRWMTIDGDAGTAMFRFDGDIESVDFLKYDITSLAYYVRSKGKAAIVGVGGGRDLLTAYLFGFRDVTGVELNPIFVDLLQNRFRDFNGVAALPGIKLEVDEARSWFASAGRGRQFDLVQMSMIDTWAATGVGAFSLSENGLYTVEGWRHFLSSLAPDGIFTVSRWYSPDNTGETGRLLSLAKATLLDLGVQDPSGHLFLAALENLSTLIVSRAPFAPADMARLHDVSERLGFTVLASPIVEPSSDVLRGIMQASDLAALQALPALYHIDVSPPTDDRPFFFNQLRITDPLGMMEAFAATAGVVSGNLAATLMLAVAVPRPSGLRARDRAVRHDRGDRHRQLPERPPAARHRAAGAGVVRADRPLPRRAAVVAAAAGGRLRSLVDRRARGGGARHDRARRIADGLCLPDRHAAGERRGCAADAVVLGDQRSRRRAGSRRGGRREHHVLDQRLHLARRRLLSPARDRRHRAHASGGDLGAPSLSDHAPSTARASPSATICFSATRPRPRARHAARSPIKPPSRSRPVVHHHGLDRKTQK